jgi:hypothetical protein
MTAGNANDDFDDELLSAYVDGELTAAERTLVEERLRSDPMAAALVDELRSLSSTIKALPRETLGRDLRAGVLAEVAQARADLDSHGPTAQSHLKSLPSPPIDRWPGIRRGLVWSALAIAATVLIAVFQPAELAQDERDLARAEKRAAEKAPPEAEAETLKRRLRGLDGAKESAKEESSVDKLAEANDVASAEALPPGLRGSMSSGGDESVAADAEAGVKSLAAEPPAPAPEAPAPPAAATVPVGESLALDAVEQDAMYAPPAEQPADVGRRADAATNEQPSDGMAALQDAPERPSGALMAASSEPTTLAMGGMGGGGAAGPRGGAMFGMAGEPGAIEEAREAGQAINATAATVTLKLAKPDGALRFQELLAESEIAPADDADRQQAFAGGQIQRYSRSEGVEDLADDAKRDAANQRVAADRLDRSHYFFYSELLPDGGGMEANDSLGVELRSGGKAKQSLENRVWVEATPAQLDALLEKCRSAKDAFAAVEADEDLPLAKRAASLSAKLEMKRQLRTESAPASSSSATEPRERVLFVLEPPAELPATEAAEAAPVK